MNIYSTVPEPSCWKDPHCIYLCVYCHQWTSISLYQRGGRMRPLAVSVFLWVICLRVSNLYACLCIYMDIQGGYVCLLRTHLQSHCWSDLGILEHICPTSLQLLNIFSSNRNYTMQINQRKTTEVKKKHQELKPFMPFHSTLTHMFSFSAKDFILAFTFVRNDR